MEDISNCPICKSSEFSQFLLCKDHTVSRETYPIVQCGSCGFRFTNPRPESSELGKYYIAEDYVSHSNTKKGFINFTYQLVRKYTLLKKLQLISRYFKSGNILDIGCGTGEFLNICENAKWITVGVEPSQDARNMAIKNYGLDVREEKAIAELEPESFDIITMWHVLEHVPQLNERIEDLKRLIKPNGLIIIAVPNCDSYDAKVYKECWGAYDVPRHLYHFKPNDMEKLFEYHNIKMLRVLPMIFDSYYVSMLSEKIRTGRNNIIRSFWNGFISNILAIKTGRKYSSQIYILQKNK